MIEDTNYMVYKHTAPNGKVYIGITKQNPEQRWKNGKGYTHNKHFYRAILSYKWKNIKHEILENGLTKEQACNKEIELIAKYDSTNPDKGYNNSTGGEYGALGIHHSVEARKKMGEASKGRIPWSKGKHLSVETRQKISEAKKGSPSPWKGKHPSAETRQKISESLKGQNLGKHLSDETRWKISEAHKGTNYSPESRQKMSESHKGKYPSPETRKKMSESHKGKTAKAVICIETGTLYSSCTEAAKAIGVAKSGITKVLHGVHKTAGGYHWKYAEA